MTARLPFGFRGIGQRLKQLRKDAGLSQVQVAERLGKPQSYVSKIEAGTKSLHLYEVFSYADALGVARAELLAAVELALTGSSTILPGKQ